MDKYVIRELIWCGLFFILGLTLGVQVMEKDTICTITITDMQGVQHVIKGKAD
jgi:hypothetical protein